jgi:hypothetical protein
VQLRAIELQSAIYATARRDDVWENRAPRPSRPTALDGPDRDPLPGSIRTTPGAVMTCFESFCGGAGGGELPGASRKRNLQRFFRVRGRRSVVAVGCWLRTAFTGGVAAESQPAVAVCGHRKRRDPR